MFSSFILPLIFNIRFCTTLKIHTCMETPRGKNCGRKKRLYKRWRKVVQHIEMCLMCNCMLDVIGSGTNIL